MAAISFKAMGPGEGLRPQVEPQLVEYGELKAIKDAGNLIPGQWYRITDYVTTVNTGMIGNARSQEQAFDILVMATGKTTLSETAFAVQHEGDEYFADSKLEAWELRYTPENVQWSKVPGVFAVDGNGYHFEQVGTIVLDETEYILWKAEDAYGDVYGSYAVSEDAEVGTTMYAYYEDESFSDEATGEIAEVNTITEAGHGTILWMKDEFGNECPYDFKNIQFKRWMATDSVSGRVGLDSRYSIANFRTPAKGLSCDDDTDFIWAFTFSSDSAGGEQEDYSLGGHNVHDNVFKPANSGLLPNNVIFGNDAIGNAFGLYCQNNTFTIMCDEVTFGYGCSGNSFAGCANVKMGKSCYNNSAGRNFGCNSFGNGCHNNSFGNDCTYNSFGENCHENVFDSWFTHNTLCNSISSNSFAANFSLSTVFDGVSSIKVTTQNVKRVQVLSGLSGASNNKLTLGFEANKAYTQVACKDSNGDLVIYVPGDVGGGG